MENAAPKMQGQFKLFLLGLETLGIPSCHVLLLASKTQTFAGFEQVQDAEFVAAFQPGLYAHSWRRGLGATVFRHPWNTSEIPSGKSLVLRLLDQKNGERGVFWMRRLHGLTKISDLDHLAHFGCTTCDLQIRT